MKKFKTLFFDLDHTLWDFESNARETISELFTNHKITHRHGIDLEEFLAEYHLVNQDLWSRYRRGLISAKSLRSERFKRAFSKLGQVPLGTTKLFGDEYMEICPRKPHVFPGAHEALAELSKEFPLYLVTNGFEKTQEIKLAASGLGVHFQEMVTSDRTGVKKPHPFIFEFTLKRAGVRPHEALMIGDDLEADVIGAQKAGLEAIYFNPAKAETQHTANHEVHELSQILDFLKRS